MNLPPGTPDWLKAKLEEAAREGRIVKDTAVNAAMIPGGPLASLVTRDTAVDPVEFADEAEFQKAVIDLAHAHGWLVAHFRPAWVKGTDGKASRMVTPVAADGKGFLDLELVRDRLIKAELKFATKVRPDQKKWIDAYKRAGVPVFVWYPCDWTEISSVLAAK